MVLTFIINQMNEQDADITKTVFLKSILNRMMTSILEDPEMTSQFVVETSEDKAEPAPQKVPLKIIEEEAPPRDSIEKEEAKSNVSRLEIEIEKNRFNMVGISGEVFFLLVDGFLEGKKSQEQGKLMLTNYRVLFFKEGVKRVDLPFGHIAKVQYIDKQLRLIYTLKYPHSWKFAIASPSKYSQFKNVGDIYYTTTHINKMFAYEYALKILPFPHPYHFSLPQQYKRLRFDSSPNSIVMVSQEKLHPWWSYPSQLYCIKFNADLNAIACHRKNKRFPILAYKYMTHSKNQVPLWISSSYEDIKSINKTTEKELLSSLRCGMKLEVFVAEGKSAKAIDEQLFDKQISVNYLKLESNEELCLAEKHLFEVFLANKRPFIKEILNSKWYNYISGILFSLQIIRNLYLQENTVLIRCESGLDKSLLLSSLLQMIMDPSFRTFKGFEALVMRMFIHNGHPFGERLGLRGSTSLICPTFLQFLDCVSQLISQNPSSFQFNFKYLAKISNFMQLNIYGTFLANSSKEYGESRIEVETCSIWPDLINPITTNGFYDKKGGVLELASSLSALRIWKEHFGDMISRNKDHYGFEQIAEDNDDYLNLYCLRLKEENEQLMIRMKQKMAELQKLEKQLKTQQVTQ